MQEEALQQILTKIQVQQGVDGGKIENIFQELKEIKETLKAMKKEVDATPVKCSHIREECQSKIYMRMNGLEEKVSATKYETQLMNAKARMFLWTVGAAAGAVSFILTVVRYILEYLSK